MTVIIPNMKLSVVIPVFNEVDNIEEILKRVKATKLASEIVVVDDGSEDGTRQVLKKLDGKRSVRVVRTDMETGYKVFRRQVVEGMPLRAHRFDFEPEFTAKVLKRHYRIYEVPISFNPRDYSEGKKIKLRDAFEAVWTLLKYRFID